MSEHANPARGRLLCGIWFLGGILLGAAAASGWLTNVLVQERQAHNEALLSVIRPETPAKSALVIPEGVTREELDQVRDLFPGASELSEPTPPRK